MDRSARVEPIDRPMPSFGLPHLLTLFAAILLIWSIYHRRGGPP